MAFETGSSTSSANLLSLMENRLSTDGWTIVRNNGAATGTSGMQLSVSDPGIAEGNQYNFVVDAVAANDDLWLMAPSTGDGGASDEFWEHPGSPGGNQNAAQVLLGDDANNAHGFNGASIAYFFFSGTTPGGSRYFHGVLEGSSGVYYHWGFGTLEKAGAFTGGQYMYGTYISATSGGFQNTTVFPLQWRPSTSASNAWVRADNLLSSGSPGWRTLNPFVRPGSTDALNGLYQGGLTNEAQRTPFAPLLIPFWDSDTPNEASNTSVLLGHLPDVMTVSMSGRSPGETLTLGSDTWHLFPSFIKDSAASDFDFSTFSGAAPNIKTGLIGLAYREP